MTDQGPSQEEQELEFRALNRKIERERGFGCASYKDKCLRRRIAVRMRACGVHTYSDYARVLDTNGAEYDRLLDALTINVTKFFRNVDAWDSLSRDVIDQLWHSELPAIRVWSAGCSSGEEPYSLAILFHRVAALTGMLAQLGRVSILGTDIDRASLAAAERAQYKEADLLETPPELRARYFGDTPPFTPAAGARALVRFARHDLLADPLPPQRFHLIVCRNVLIYFDRPTQERLFEGFHQALEPGGFLFLGKVETLLGPSRARFAAVNARDRIFRRP